MYAHTHTLTQQGGTHTNQQGQATKSQCGAAQTVREYNAEAHTGRRERGSRQTETNVRVHTRLATTAATFFPSPFLMVLLDLEVVWHRIRLSVSLRAVRDLTPRPWIRPWSHAGFRNPSYFTHSWRSPHMTCCRREPRATGTGISRISPRFPPTISIKKRFEVQKHIFIQGMQTKKMKKAKKIIMGLSLKHSLLVLSPPRSGLPKLMHSLNE